MVLTSVAEAVAAAKYVAMVDPSFLGASRPLLAVLHELIRVRLDGGARGKVGP